MDKIEKINIADVAFEAMEGEIMRGEWPVNTKIRSEMELASELGISRVVLREALARLRGAGYIEVRPGAGTYVVRRSRKFSMDSGVELMPVLGFRRIIEPESISMAADKGSGIDEIEGYFTTMINTPTEDIDSYAKADCDFHIAIARASGNFIIESIMDEILGRKYSQTMITTVGLIGKEVANRDHQSMVEALRSKDAQKAKEAMQNHLDKVIKNWQKEDKNKVI
jgi:DNA-binding FadR family transcriptional regulator